MSETAYCYTCAVHHPIEEMRQILTKAGKRWRCVRRIELAKKPGAAWEAFGQKTTANNKAEARSKISRLTNPERNQYS
jgi:hypothetical protein